MKESELYIIRDAIDHACVIIEQLARDRTLYIADDQLDEMYDVLVNMSDQLRRRMERAGEGEKE